MTTRRQLLARIKSSAAASSRNAQALAAHGRIDPGTTDSVSAGASAKALHGAADTLQALLVVDPAPPAPPPPPPPPPAEPPPPPPPPPDISVGPMKSRLINPARAILIEGGFVVSRYERGQRPTVWRGNGAEIVDVIGYNFATGGALRPLAGTYTLRHAVGAPEEWADVETQQASAGACAFPVDKGALAEGWHWFDVVGPAGETTIPQPVYVIKGARAEPQALMPVLTHSHDMIFPTVGRNEEMVWNVPAAERTTIHFGMVPARFAPTANPLTPRACPPMSTIDAAQLVCTQLAPSRMSDIHRATVTDAGVWTTSGSQAYHYSDFVAKVPVWALLDGPRGVGTVTAPTHLQVGRDGKIYGTDPWRFFKIGADGHVTTLAGWRHKTPPANWTGAPNLELVGDWSAVQGAKGLHEAWGMAWDARTLAVNEGAAPIPTEGNEKPHIVGPVAFIADTQNNRVLRVEFSAVSHAVPARVTEFVTGLGDPWDIVFHVDEIIVSERTSHRIAAYDATTGALRRVIVQGAALGYVDGSRKPRPNPTASLQQLQAEPCVLPEGLYVLDGWLYYGSKVQQQIRRIRLDGGRWEKVLDIYVDGNSVYCKFAVSDGTFGPRGSLFVVTWSNRKYGYPHAYLPDGTEAHILPGNPQRGTLWADGGYSTAVAVGQGRLVCGYVQEGLTMLSAALPTDGTKPANAGAGALDYWRRGLRSSHGVNGWGHYGLPLPWGTSADIDAFLTYCGHRRPE